MPFKYKDYHLLLGDRRIDVEQARNRMVALLDLYREAFDLKRKDLAEELHFNEGVFSNLCSGRNNRFTGNTLLRICYLLGISIDYVLFGEDADESIRSFKSLLEKKATEEKE